MLKVDKGCFYVITTNANKPHWHTEVVEVRSLEKERDGKRYVQRATGRYYASMISDSLSFYLNDNDNWYSFVGQLDPSKDKKKSIMRGEAGVHRTLIKMLFEFEGKSIRFR